MILSVAHHIKDLAVGARPPLPLHAPDGFFSIPVSAAGYAVSALVVGYAIHRANRQFNERMVPMMGVMAAFIFAAQMINFPVAGGTSGHLIGGALAAIVLGPWAAILVVTAVVGLQALLFQDGGLVVMGVNIFTMSIMSVLSGYAAYWLVARLGRGYAQLTAGGFIAAWASVVAAAVATALLLGASGTTSLAVALPAMTATHMVIGIGEGLITVFALAFIHKARPDILQIGNGVADGADGARGGSLGKVRLWAAGYAIAVAVAAIAPLASGAPDGLERFAEDAGFIGAALDAPYALIPDYALPGVSNEAVATMLAGVIGVTAVYLLIAGAAYLLTRAFRSAPQPE